ncbi:hypothetical protein K4B79_44095 [Streptomyces lincolnensis]|uniref:hypothetical protein n=1 Tax=Streptomyces lincolnensis TaxID=1915 RepID=UPI001E4171A3|nr:hypothetical protein [Streptomyces lincolnensis]MCD7445161.1 hypothetical protein [Streptomyces lincolnensis]
MPEAVETVRDVREPRLASWSEVFNCYTAALATWLAVRTTAWWRPLLAGGPTLAVREADEGLLRYDHHPRPPLEVLGLVVRHGDDWRQVYEAQQAELAAHGALVVCGDTYHQPWHRGYRRRHAPHWITVVRDGHGDAVEDPLSLITEAGPQRPRRIEVAPAQFAQWARALPGTDPVHRLRERSVAGGGDLALGARYRWLAVRDGPGEQAAAVPDPTRLTGADAVLAVAARFRPGAVRDLRQADDLWQALRQRELLLAAAEADPGLLDEEALRHWRAATAWWRRVPPLLARLRLREAAGLATDTTRLVGVLTELAPFEGRHLAADRSPLR